MIKGQRVRYLGGVGEEYLTVYKEYVVISGLNDKDFDGDMISRTDVFEIVNDQSDVSYCVYPVCCHGSWELIDDESE